MEEARLNLSCEEMIVYQLWEDVNLKSVVEAGVILGLCQVVLFWVERTREPESFRKRELWAEIGVAYLKILCVIVCGRRGKWGA